MCDQQVEVFRCVCGTDFGDPEVAVRHVEETHIGEFDVRDLDATEEAIRARITPSPIDTGYASYLLEE